MSGGSSKKGPQDATIPTYYLDAQFFLTLGPIDKISRFVVDEKSAWNVGSTGGTISVNAPDLFGGTAREGGIVGDIDFDFGYPTQTPNTYLETQLGTPIPAYRSVVSAIYKSLYVGTNYYLKSPGFLATRVHTRKKGVAQWQDAYAEITSTELAAFTKMTFSGNTCIVTMFLTDALRVGQVITVANATEAVYNGTFTVTYVLEYEVRWVLTGTPTAQASGATISYVDGDLINGVHVIRDCLTDTEWGKGYTEDSIDEVSFLVAAITCYNEGLGFGFLWDRIGTVDDFITDVLKHIQGALYRDRITGLWILKLTREITSPELLPLITMANARKVSNFKKKLLGELVSQVIIKFTSNGTFKTDSYTISDISLAGRQAIPISKSIDYQGVTNLTVAQKLGNRDLRELSTPVYACEIEDVGEVAINLNVGDPFRLYVPDLLDATLIMRVKTLDLGSNTRNAIRISCVQDYFHAPELTYNSSPVSSWVSPISPPKPVVDRVLEEIPYYLVAINQGDSFAQAVADTESYIIVAGGSPTPDAVSANIYSTTGTTFTKNGSMNFCFTATLSSSIDRQVTSIPLSNVNDFILLSISSFIKMGDEYMAVTAATESSLTVLRGVLDSIPVAHNAGEVIFGLGDYSDTDKITYLLSETVKVKLTTVAPRGELTLANAPEDTVTMVGRMHLPYPPANVKLNNTYYPTTVEKGILTLTWASRNRFQQTTGFTSYYAGNITSETGVTYSGELIRTDTSAILLSFTGEQELTRVLNTSGIAYTGQVLLKLWSDNVNGSSFYTFEHLFNLTAPTGTSSLLAPLNLIGTFTSQDLVLSWDHNTGNSLSLVDKYILEIQTSGSVTKRTVEVALSGDNGGDYTYTFAKNTIDFVTPSRVVRAKAYYKATDGNLSPDISATFTNDEPATPVFTITVNVNSVTIDITPLSLPDLAGYIIFMGTSPSFTKNSAAIVYDGLLTSVTISTDILVTYYFAVGAYDVFGYTL